MTGTEGESAVMLFMIIMQLLVFCLNGKRNTKTVSDQSIGKEHSTRRTEMKGL
jgi:hypothetical protein